MKARFVILLAVLLCVYAPSAFAWTSVGDGIEYQQFAASGPNNVFVCRLLCTNTNATIDSCSAYGTTIGGREVMTAQGARYDQAIGYWGKTWGVRNALVCTINGDYEDANDPTGVMLEGFVHSGSYDKQYGIPTCGGAGFGWSLNRVPSMPDTASVTDYKQLVTYTATAVQQQFQGINRARGSNELVIYTPLYDYYTHADNSGVEVVVKLSSPFLILPTPNSVKGNVIEIRQGQSGANIPFDCIVLSATGSAATTLLNNVSIGAEVGVGQEPTFYNKDCSAGSGIDWTNLYSSVGGNVRFLRNGVIEHNTQAGMIARNPRTAICYNATYVFFVVCDGRSVSSVGWTNDEMATFCLNTLAATEGINQDGGGSSEMVVNGVVKNVPSDGAQRAVVNGIMMVNVQAKQQNTTFTVGQQVTTNASASVRLGPGTNYTSIATASSGSIGNILTHSLNGVLAKGSNWWYVDFGSSKGWVAESLLGGGGCTSVSITAQPQNQTVATGATATFTVAASGTTPLSYQWQKNSVNLNNGGNISGALTATLSVTNCQTTDQGNYRCVVSNSCPSSATSNNATLTVTGGGTTIILDEEVGTYTGSWSTVTGQGTYGYNGDYKYAGTATSETASCKWTPNLTVTGNWDVYVMYASGSNRSAAAPYTVYYNGGSQTYQVNQQTGGGVWQFLGTKQFNSGTAGYVKLSNYTSESAKIVIADAVKFVSAGGGGCTSVSITTQPSNQMVAAGATATFTVGASGTTPLSYQWQKNSVNLNNGGNISGALTATLSVTNCQTTDQGNYRCVVSNSCPSSATSNDATLTISGGGGTTVILDEDQGTYSGAWSLSTGAGTAAYNGDYKWANSAISETAWWKWTPNLTATGNYAVYVMFRSGANRPTNAPYTIYYNGGSQTYPINQTINGGVWVLLGTKAFLAGTSGYVKLSNNTGSTGTAVIADAVKWVPQ